MKRGGITFGLISILCAFIVLILGVFSVLALASANSEANMTDRVVASVAEYYAADTAAEEQLARIDALLNAGDMAAVAALNVTVFEEGGLMHLAYTVPINDGSSLNIELSALPTNGDGWRYERLVWSAAANEQTKE